MSAESLAAFHAFMAEQERKRKRQRPSLVARARRRAVTEPRLPAGVVDGNRGTTTARDRSLLRRSVVVTGAVTLGVGLGTGGAVAFWTGTAAGTGSASTATMAAVTVSPGTVSTGTLLYPGLAANGSTTGGDLVVSVTNPNPFPVSVVLSARSAAPATGCTNPDVSLRAGTITIPADTHQPVTFPLRHSVGMGTGSTSDCQDKTITVPVQAAITSTATS